MQDLLRRFVREPDGAWRCVEAAELYLPGGRRVQFAIGARFVRGHHYMGVEVALLLDEYFENSRRGAIPG
jgi:hypothetical protein